MSEDSIKVLLIIGGVVSLVVLIYHLVVLGCRRALSEHEAEKKKSDL